MFRESDVAEGEAGDAGVGAPRTGGVDGEEDDPGEDHAAE